MNRCAIIALTFAIVSLLACNCGGVQQQKPNEKVVGEGKAKDGPPSRIFTPNQAALIDHFRLQLLSGGIGKLPYVHDGRFETVESKKPLLWIKISLGNKSETKLEQYHPWSGEFFAMEKDRASLKDEFGNEYFNLKGSFSRPFGQLTGMTRIDPGASIEDIIVFDPPIKKAKEFTLEFPGGNIGKSGTRIVFKVPRSFFKEPGAENE